ncbi:MAG: ABC transporter permease [Spirochaetales bacterium]|nr:MAG: ABC transporter permease [Spirochaetales bacterium]
MIGNAAELMIPILLAALGGVLSERAGVLNIGLEGLILVGAFGGILGVNLTTTLLGGLVFGIAMAMILALLYSYASIELRSNIFIAGLATNLLAAGLVPYLSQLIFHTRGVVRSSSIVGFPRFLGISVAFYLAIGLAVVVHVVLFRTPLGMRIRALGDGPAILEARGLSPNRYKRAVMLLSGGFAGLAGAQMAIRLGVYLPNISAGRGWIALVAVFLGLRHPLGVVVAAGIFALFDSFAGAAQGFTEIPGSLLLGLPYLITLVAMVVYSAFRRESRV